MKTITREEAIGRIRLAHFNADNPIKEETDVVNAIYDSFESQLSKQNEPTLMMSMESFEDYHAHLSREHILRLYYDALTKLETGRQLTEFEPIDEEKGQELCKAYFEKIKDKQGEIVAKFQLGSQTYNHFKRIGFEELFNDSNEYTVIITEDNKCTK